MSIDKKYTRRALLNRIGGSAAVTALYPFIPVTEADAATVSGGVPLRFFYWYMPILPKRNIVATWLPKKQSKLEWTGAMSGLNEMADRMTCIRGLTNSAAYDSPLSGGHKASGMTMLSGWSAQKGVSNQYSHLWKGANGFNGHDSLDQWLARKLTENNVKTPRTDIRMGWQNKGHTNDPVWKSISFKNGVVQQRHQMPEDLYKDIFNLGGNAPVIDYGPKFSVLNHLTSSLKRLQGKLGREDSMRMEAHLDSISELERQFKSAEAASNQAGGACNIDPSLNSGGDRWDFAIESYSRLAQIIFSCDITRIAGAQWMSHLWAGQASFLDGVNGGYHGATHNNGNVGMMNAVQRFRVEVFLRLMKLFDGVEEANGKTLLDNSIVYWFAEVSGDHNWYDQCNIIAGGGGYFKMGLNHVEGGNHNRDNNRPQTKLLANFIDAFGFEPGNFISPKYDKGTLANVIKA